MEYLEILDEDHSATEERFIAVGPIMCGVIVVVSVEIAARMISARPATRNEIDLYQEHMETRR